MYLLVVEDDPKLQAKLRERLTEWGYRVDALANADEAFEQGLNPLYRLILLDIMLPGSRDGFALVQQWREQGMETPILMLTALDRVFDKVNGLRTGADDYLTKPFAFVELQARIESLLRRGLKPTASTTDSNQLHFEDLTLDLSARSVQRGPHQVSLTEREFCLLKLLLEFQGRVLSRREIGKALWGVDYDFGTNAVDVIVRRLRQKVDDRQARPLIQTVRGIGYAIQPAAPD